MWDLRNFSIGSQTLRSLFAFCNPGPRWCAQSYFVLYSRVALVCVVWLFFCSCVVVFSFCFFVYSSSVFSAVFMCDGAFSLEKRFTIRRARGNARKDCKGKIPLRLYDFVSFQQVISNDYTFLIRPFGLSGYLASGLWATNRHRACYTYYILRLDLHCYMLMIDTCSDGSNEIIPMFFGPLLKTKMMQGRSDPFLSLHGPWFGHPKRRP